MSFQVSRRTAVAVLALLAAYAASTPQPTTGEPPASQSTAAQSTNLPSGDTPSGGPQPGDLPPNDPWAGEGVTVRGARSVVVGHRAEPGLLRDLARRADRAAERVAKILKRPVSPVVIVPATTGEAAALAGVGAVDGLAALAAGNRVIVIPETFAKLTDTGRDVVLTHELTHVAAGTDGVPYWLREGFADYVAYRDAGLPTRAAAAELAAEVRGGRLPTELPGPSSFAAGGVRLAQSYQEAWLACRFISERFGEENLVRLYGEARERGLDLTSLGMTVEDLTARWRDYVRKQLA